MFNCNVLFSYTAKHHRLVNEKVELYQDVNHLQYRVDKLEAGLATFVTDVDSKSMNRRAETFKLESTRAKRKTTRYNNKKVFRQSEWHWKKKMYGLQMNFSKQFSSHFKFKLYFLLI